MIHNEFPHFINAGMKDYGVRARMRTFQNMTRTMKRFQRRKRRKVTYSRHLKKGPFKTTQTLNEVVRSPYQLPKIAHQFCHLEGEIVVKCCRWIRETVNQLRHRTGLMKDALRKNTGDNQVPSCCSTNESKITHERLDVHIVSSEKNKRKGRIATDNDRITDKFSG